jgi:hypothetical protein
MTVVAVDRPERWTHWSKWSQLHPFDQTDVSLINLVHSSCACGEGSDWDRIRGTGQVRPHLAGPAVPGSCGTLVPLPPKCVHVHKNCNTTRGTLLVTKMCMKLVVYSSRTRGFDGRNIVVRTINKLPLAKRLLVLEQSLDLALVDQGLHGVITRQVLAHKLHALLANLKRLVREKLSLTLPVGLLAFHLAFGGWKVERILTLHILLFLFSRSYFGVFENFAKQDKVPWMVPSIAQVVFVTSPKALSEPQLPTSMACMWIFG